MEDDRITKKDYTTALISIHVPRVEDDGYACGMEQGIEAISIHVPRVEDDLADAGGGLPLPISIHVPRVEDDKDMERFIKRNLRFQSTSPVWRTT